MTLLIQLNKLYCHSQTLLTRGCDFIYFILVLVTGGLRAIYNPLLHCNVLNKII